MNRIEVVFYPDGVGGPVKDYLLDLKFRDIKAYAKLLGDLEELGLNGTRSGALTIRPMGSGLWELKRLYAGTQYRIFFCIVEGAAWLLHAFEKKSAKTPHSDLRLAIRRMRGMTK